VKGPVKWRLTARVRSLYQEVVGGSEIPCDGGSGV
jgi:hypothetical protein